MARGAGDLPIRQRPAQGQAPASRRYGARFLLAQPHAVHGIDQRKRNVQRLELRTHDGAAFGRSRKADDEDWDHARNPRSDAIAGEACKER